MLTGKEIAARRIIDNFLPENIQQQGIDIRVIDIKQVSQTQGLIPQGNHRKTTIPHSLEIQKSSSPQDSHILGWELQPGYYEITFKEGCLIPSDCCLQFKSRSSLIRCGGEVRSGLFDAGFATKNMGAYLKIEIPIFIEEEARIAQVIVVNSNPVDNLYNGD